MLIIRVDFFKWGKTGLEVSSKFYENGRKAMDDAYSTDWDVVKIYENGNLYHQEAKQPNDFIYT